MRSNKEITIGNGGIHQWEMNTKNDSIGSEDTELIKYEYD
jgi:hypothetical protein